VANYEPKGSVKEGVPLKYTGSAMTGIHMGTGSTLSMEDVRAKWEKKERVKAAKIRAGKVSGVVRSTKTLEKQRLAYLRYLELLVLYAPNSRKTVAKTAEELGFNVAFVERAIVAGLKNKWHKEVP